MLGGVARASPSTALCRVRYQRALRVEDPDPPEPDRLLGRFVEPSGRKRKETALYCNPEVGIVTFSAAPEFLAGAAAVLDVVPMSEES